MCLLQSIFKPFLLIGDDCLSHPFGNYQHSKPFSNVPFLENPTEFFRKQKNLHCGLDIIYRMAFTLSSTVGTGKTYQCARAHKHRQQGWVFG